MAMRKIYCGQDSFNRGTCKTDRISLPSMGPIGNHGEFMLIDKREIYVDESYQRKPGKADSIAKSFSWRAFCVVCIAVRDGKYIAFDGQHRVEAACMRSDITMIPCMVFASDGVHQEARDFIEIQGNRRKVDAIDRFRAMIVAKDPAAIEIGEIISSCGYRIDRNGDYGNISAIGHADSAYRTAGPELLRFALNFCSQFYEKRATGLLFSSIAIIEKKLRAKGDSLMNYADKICIYEEVMREVKKTAVMAGLGLSYGIYEVAIIGLINKGKRTKHVSIQ